MSANFQRMPNGPRHFSLSLHDDAGKLLFISRPIPEDISTRDAADMLRRHGGISAYYRTEPMPQGEWRIAIVSSNQQVLAYSPTLRGPEHAHEHIALCLRETPYAELASMPAAPAASLPVRGALPA